MDPTVEPPLDLPGINRAQPSGWAHAITLTFWIVYGLEGWCCGHMNIIPFCKAVWRSKTMIIFDLGRATLEVTKNPGKGVTALPKLPRLAMLSRAG